MFALLGSTTKQVWRFGFYFSALMLLWHRLHILKIATRSVSDSNGVFLTALLVLFALYGY
jgi:hypothetical protein